MGYFGSPSIQSATSVTISGGTLTTLQGNPPWTVDVIRVGGSAVTLGQKLSASSIPVVLSSDQSAIPVTGTFFQATQPISGTVTANAGTNLNTSSLALESGGNLDAIETDLDTLVANSPALGQALAAGSVPVVLTAAQITTLTPPPAITGFALESGGNLDAIETDMDTLVATVTASLDTTTAPSQSVLISGESNDGTPQYNPIPLGAGGRTVIVEGFPGGTAVPISVGTVTVTGSVNATLQTQTDTVMVGGVNIKEINAVTPLMGNGTTGTGSLRVTIASDNTAFAVNATLSAETTKVIGTVNQGTSPWIVAGGGTAGTAATGVVTVQGIAGMTKVLVTPDSVALPANQSVNVAQVAGNNTVTVASGIQTVGLGDGTNTINVLKSDGTAAGQNAQIVGGTGYTTGTLSLSSGTQSTSWYDMLNYAWVSVEILTNTTPATLTFQTSGDSSQTNITSMGLVASQNSTSAVGSTTTSATGTFHGPRAGRYFRVTSNLAGGNTATLVLTFYTIPSQLQSIGVTAGQNGTWNIGTVTTVTAVTSITNQVDTNLKQVGGTNTVTAGVAGTLAVGGNVATNVAIGTDPINLGAQAVSSENTAVTATRMVQLVADLVGKLIVLPYSNPENFVSGAITTAMTSTTSTSLIAAPASGLRNYITQITVSNSHATVGTDIIIQDGSGGTTLYTIPAAAAYGGATLTFPTPLRQPTTATAIYCANVTTGSSIKVSASGYKGA